MAYPANYNLYEKCNNDKFWYYLSSIPCDHDDKLILANLDSEIILPGYVSGFMVKREHYPNPRKHEKIADDFDVCSPVFQIGSPNAYKFAKEEFGNQWRKTHKFMFVNTYNAGHI